jgi:hypothetical protein
MAPLANSGALPLFFKQRQIVVFLFKIEMHPANVFAE